MAKIYRHSINCPHCGELARVRSSRAVSATYKQLNLQCGNIDCGATFGAAFEILHEIAPPRLRNPDVHLRSAPARVRQVPVPANDGGPEVPPAVAANDDGQVGEAVSIGR